jgi:hypothetical protein
VDPAHTAGDGDGFVVAATGSLEAVVETGVVRSLAAYAVEAAILDAFDRADEGGP